jgi:hypothetical protein
VGTHTGSIIIDISANTTETGTMVLNGSGAGSASYTSVLIRPSNDGVTVSGASATGRGLIELNGADNVTIDGDNPNTTGTNRNLTITNTASSTTTSTSVVRLAVATSVITSADNNTIKNLIINGSATGRNASANTSTAGSENASFGIFAGGGASTVSATTAPSTVTTGTTVGSGATMANLIIQNNSITACGRGISVLGSATSVINSLTVSNNTIGAVTSGSSTTVYSMGMTLQGFAAASISGNTVQNIESYLASSTGIRGIDLGGVSPSGAGPVVEKNIVTGVYNRNTSGYGAYGIDIELSNVSGASVRNNFISGVKNDVSGSSSAFSTTYGAFGIRIGGGNNHSIYFNSISMSGAVGTGANDLTASLGIVSTSSTGLDVRNNILQNRITGGTSSSAHVSLYLPSSGTSAMNLTLNNNAYITGTSTTQAGVLQVSTTYSASNLYLASNFVAASTSPSNNARAYTSTLSAGGANDASSFASTTSAPFVSSSDLHLTGTTATQLESGGASISGLSTDIDGDARPGPAGSVNGGATAPDMGADEFDGVPLLPQCTTPSAQPTSLVLTPGSTSVAGSFTAASPAATNYLVVAAPTGTTPSNPVDGTTYATGSSALGTGTSIISNGTGTTFNATGLSSNTAYDFYVYANNNGGCTGGPKYYTTSPLTGTTTTCLSAPTGITTSSITSSGFTVGWSAVSGATGYSVQVSTSPTLAPGFDITGSPFSATGTSQSVSGLTAGTVYYYSITPVGGSCTTNSSIGSVSTPVVNDECSTAISLTSQSYVAIGSGCPSGVTGTTVAATQSSNTAPPTSAFSSSNDDDVWYDFQATNTMHVVRLCNVTFPVGSTVQMGIVLTNGCTSSNTEITGNPSGSLVTLSSGAAEMSFSGLTIGNTYKIRVLTSGTSSRANFTISVLDPPPMTYVSSNAVQASTASVQQGTANVQILQVLVVVSGIVNPLSATSLTFSTNGTTAAGDIAKARVYYTGTSSTFATTTQFGSDYTSPNGSFTITGSQALTSTGTGNTTNYFWLVYDVDCNATPTDVVDGELSSLIISSTSQTPTTSAPTGSRTVTGTTVTTTDPNSTTAVAAGSVNNQFAYALVPGISACPATVSSVSFTVSGTSPSADIARAKVYYTTTSTFSTANQFGSTVSSPSAGTVTFTGTQSLANGNNYFWLVYDISCTATVTNTVNGDVAYMVINGTTYTPSSGSTSANAVSASTGIYNTVASGDWNQGSTWACGTPPPSATTPVIISNAVTITSTQTGLLAGSVTISSAGSLTISGGDLTMGASSAGAATGNSNRVLQVDGTLTITGGTLNLNGSYTQSSTGTLNMSGGVWNIDPNDGTSAGSASGATFTVSSITNASQLNVTGGNINLLDPPYSSGSRAVAYSTSSLDIAFGTGNTFAVGGGDDVNPSNTSGFYIEGNVLTGTLEIGNLVINGGRYSAQRHASTYTSSLYITKARNLTVNSGAELVINLAPMAVTGNLVNDGVITTTSTSQGGNLAMVGDAQYSGGVQFSPSSSGQTISGNGYFKYTTAASDPTAQAGNLIAGLTVYHSAASPGLTLSMPLTATGFVQLLGGQTNTTTTNFLALGNPTSISGNPATLTETAGTLYGYAGTSPASQSGGVATYATPQAWSGGWVSGPFKKYFTPAITSTTTTQGILPVGSAMPHPGQILFTAAPSTGGYLTGTWISGSGVSSVSPTLTESSITPSTVDQVLNAMWQVDADASLTGTAYTSRFNYRSAALIDYTNVTLLKRSNASSAWALNGTYAATAGSNTSPAASRTGMSGFSQFAIGGNASAVSGVILPVIFVDVAARNEGVQNRVDFSVSAEQDVARYEVEHSVDGRTFTKIGSVTPLGAGAAYLFFDPAPQYGINYYRVRALTQAGTSIMSKVVSADVKTVSPQLEAYPNPVTDVLTVSLRETGKELHTMLRITNMEGKELLRQAVENGQAAFHMAHLPAGTYLLQVVGDGRSEAIHVLKK